MERLPLESAGLWREAKIHHSVYILSRRLVFLQHKMGTFSLSPLLCVSGALTASRV